MCPLPIVFNSPSTEGRFPKLAPTEKGHGKEQIHPRMRRLLNSTRFNPKIASLLFLTNSYISS